MALDLSGLKPLEADDAAPVSAPAPRLDTAGLKPLDTSGLRPLEAPRQGLAAGMGNQFVRAGTTDSAGMFLRGLGANIQRGTTEVQAALARVRDAAMSGRVDEARQLIRTEPAFTTGDRQALNAELSDILEGNLDPSGMREVAVPGAGKTLADNPLLGAARRVEEAGKQAFPVSDENAQRLPVKIAGGLGTFAGSVATGIATGPLAPAATPFLMGMMGSGEAQQRAEQKGATEQQQMDAAAAGLLPGLIDVLPVNNILKPFARLAPWATTRIKAAAYRAIEEGVLEGTTEGVQQFVQNIIAKTGYDPSQELLDGVLENALVGTFVGKIGGGAAGYIRGPELPEGERDKERKNVPPLSPDDRSSPIPDSSIQRGREVIADALGRQKADELLKKHGVPGVGSRVVIDLGDGRAIGGEVTDGFTVTTRTGKAGLDGVRIRLDDGTEVAQFIEPLLRGGGSIRAEAPKAPAEPGKAPKKPAAPATQAPAATTPSTPATTVSTPATTNRPGASQADAIRAEAQRNADAMAAERGWQPLYASEADDAPITGYWNPATSERRTVDEHVAAVEAERQASAPKPSFTPSDQWQPVPQGAQLPPGLETQTGPDGAMQARLPPGSKVTQTVTSKDPETGVTTKTTIATDAGKAAKAREAEAAASATQAPSAAPEAPTIGSEAPSSPPVATAGTGENYAENYSDPIQPAPVTAEVVKQGNRWRVEVKEGENTTSYAGDGGRPFASQAEAEAFAAKRRQQMAAPPAPEGPAPEVQNTPAPQKPWRSAFLPPLEPTTPPDQVSPANEGRDGSRTAPIVVETPADLAIAEQQERPDPTDPQKEPGNYAKIHVRYRGLDLSIENKKGSVRSNKDPNGPKWSVTMPASYGYIKRTQGKDGDHVDAYLGDTPQSERVFVINQIDPKTGKFDEVKVMLGFPHRVAAISAYNRGFSDGSGASRRGSIHETTINGLKDWLASDAGSGEFRAATGEARLNSDADVSPVAERSGSVPESEQPVLPQLRGAGDRDAPAVGGELSPVPVGSGGAANPGAYPGEGGQSVGVRSGQPPLGDAEGAGAEYAQERAPDGGRSNTDDGGVGRGDRLGAVNPALSLESRGDDAGAGREDAEPGRPTEAIDGETWWTGLPVADRQKALLKAGWKDKDGKLNPTGKRFTTTTWARIPQGARATLLKKVRDKAPAKPREKKPGKPKSLIPFLASTGGITDPTHQGEFDQMGLTTKWVPGAGRLIRKDARSGETSTRDGRKLDLDAAVERAIEAGYLREGSDINDLLAALDQEMRGQKRYADSDLSAVVDMQQAERDAADQDRYGTEEEYREAQRDNARARVLTAAGDNFALNDEEVDRVIAIMEETGMDPVDAIDRFIEDEGYATEDAMAEEATEPGNDDIPFDIPFDPVAEAETGAAAGAPLAEAEGPADRPSAAGDPDGEAAADRGEAAGAAPPRLSAAAKRWYGNFSVMKKLPNILQVGDFADSDEIVYHSIFRPLFSTMGAKLGEVGGPEGRWLKTKQPLTLDEMATFELVPVTESARTAAVMEAYRAAAGEANPETVNLAEYGDLTGRGVLISPDLVEDGVWRQSYYNGEALTGHETLDTMGHKFRTIESAVFDAWQGGYREPDPGHMDRMAENWAEQPQPDTPPAKPPTAEAGAEGLPQLVIPGTEQSAKQAMAARDAKGGKKAKVGQKAADEGLFAPPEDTRQTDIEQAAAEPDDAGEILEPDEFRKRISRLSLLKGAAVFEGEGSGATYDPLLRQFVVGATVERTAGNATAIARLAVGSSPQGAWRDAEITGTLEDGRVVDMPAGPASDLLAARFKQALSVVECMRR